MALQNKFPFYNHICHPRRRVVGAPFVEVMIERSKPHVCDVVATLYGCHFGLIGLLVVEIHWVSSRFTGDSETSGTQVVLE